MNTKISITRLDVNNDMKLLPSLEKVSDIVNENEIRCIQYYFESKEEAQQFALQFPKSFKAKVNVLVDKGSYQYFTEFNFNTYWMNNTTDTKNESAELRRKKVIDRLKSLEFPQVAYTTGKTIYNGVEVDCIKFH